MAAIVEEVLSAPRAATRPRALACWAAVGITLGAAVLVAVRLDAPGFFDNEARYAEVAREMVQSGDWLSPRLDYWLFLNKPPLTFWLAALVFTLAGVSEWARLVSVGAAAVTLFATCRLGAMLYGEAAGLAAGVALATTLGFVLEARTLRPDLLVTAAVTVALACWQAAERAPERRTRWLVGLYAALGLGILAKGFVPVVIVALPIAALTLGEHGWRGIGRLRPGLGLAVMAAIVLPWHVAVSLRHPGFAWDYVVNQHLLFFLDKKLPRDSEGDTLAFFWSAFAGRAFPWVIFLPLTLREGMRGMFRRAAPAERATFLLWAWTGGLLLFFSAAPSRLEHYSLPALPAAALLAGRVWQRARARDVPPAAWRWIAMAAGLAVLLGLAGSLGGRAFLAQTYWLLQVPSVIALALPAALTVLMAGLIAFAGALRRRPAWVAAALAASMVPLVAIVLRAEVEAEPLFSWRPVARALVAAVPAEVPIVFEAPEEYQLVGGLAFYTGRRIELLQPPGYVPPTYLADAVREMFVPRPIFAQRWLAGERLAFVSDPQRRREDPSGLVPGSFHVLGRFGDRWVLTSFPPSSSR